MDKAVFEKEIAKIVEISKEYGALKVILFGSCLEDLNLARDIDIAVKGIKASDFFSYYGKVSMEVKDPVDIVDLDDLREHLYKRILSKGRVLYG